MEDCESAQLQALKAGLLAAALALISLAFTRSFPGTVASEASPERADTDAADPSTS